VPHFVMINIYRYDGIKKIIKGHIYQSQLNPVCIKIVNQLSPLKSILYTILFKPYGFLELILCISERNVCIEMAFPPKTMTIFLSDRTFIQVERRNDTGACLSEQKQR